MLFERSDPKVHLTDIQRQVHAAEQELNFREIARFASKPEVPLSEPLRDTTIYDFIAQIGQYSELAHGSIPVRFVFNHLKALAKPRYPLHGYNALIGDETDLVDCFKGDVGELQCYVAFRPHVGHLVAAISGTSQPDHALNDLDFRLVHYGIPETHIPLWGVYTAVESFRDTFSKSAGGEKQGKVHAGFWRMYQGLKTKAIQAVGAGLERHGERVTEIVVTGHSMGGSLSYLLMMDIMEDMQNSESEIYRIIGHRPPKLRLVVFGAPRVGNKGLVDHWTGCITRYRKKDEDMFQEYSVKAHDDGVHILPPHFLGYRHLTKSPFYLHEGILYPIPAEYREFGRFEVDSPNTVADAVTPTSVSDVTGTDPHHFSWPLGGHNYYFRDMERLQRRLKWLESSSKEEEGWEQRYADKLKEWEIKHPVNSP